MNGRTIISIVTRVYTVYLYFPLWVKYSLVPCKQSPSISFRAGLCEWVAQDIKISKFSPKMELAKTVFGLGAPEGYSSKRVKGEDVLMRGIVVV